MYLQPSSWNNFFTILTIGSLLLFGLVDYFLGFGVNTATSNTCCISDFDFVGKSKNQNPRAGKRQGNVDFHVGRGGESREMHTFAQVVNVHVNVSKTCKKSSRDVPNVSAHVLCLDYGFF